MTQKIIDSHAHLGDILYGQNITFKQNVRKRDHHNYLVQLEENDMVLPSELETIDPVVLAESVLNEEQARNGTATLQNLQISMDENGIDQVWVLPVLPHVGFEEVLAASRLDDRIVPFTCVDFTLGEEAGEKILADADAGARGLKLHPILQRVSLLSEEVSAALEAWAETGKPVISHTYPFGYFHPEESYRNCPEFGSNTDFLDLVEKFPQIDFVAAHAGGPFDYAELFQGEHMSNLYVDTSFQAVPNVREFIKRFGPNRVLFGSDWPWGTQAPPVRIVKEACDGDKELENRIFYQNAIDLLKG